MYYIKLQGIENREILRNIYQSIDVFRLSNRSFLLYEIPYTTTIPIKEIKAHAFLIDLNLYNSEDEELLEDLVFDLIEVRSNVLVKFSGDNAVNVMFTELYRAHGLNVIPWSNEFLEKEITIQDLGYTELQIINEIFELPVATLQFSEGDFIIKLIVGKDGIVTNEEGTVIGELQKEYLIEILHKKPDHFRDKISKVLNDYNLDTPFTPKFYEPWPFLLDEDNVTEKIIDYKYKVFNFIKNIEPKDYPNLPHEVVKILNENNYIQMKDIVNVLEESGAN
ncbi:hypothetical protein [Alkaliphilus transvaalensis]|uniref:hypothetical protein n=1 Tax=Alkaliphilus transvaalensis TaxID=114628 RepID=UPI0004793D42|nr:hypothetical protein [Alkaliphilus transvaalensis]